MLRWWRDQTLWTVGARICYSDLVYSQREGCYFMNNDGEAWYQHQRYCKMLWKTSARHYFMIKGDNERKCWDWCTTFIPSWWRFHSLSDTRRGISVHERWSLVYKTRHCHTHYVTVLYLGSTCTALSHATPILVCCTLGPTSAEVVHTGMINTEVDGAEGSGSNGMHWHDQNSNGKSWTVRYGGLFLASLPSGSQLHSDWPVLI